MVCQGSRLGNPRFWRRATYTGRIRSPTRRKMVAMHRAMDKTGARCGCLVEVVWIDCTMTLHGWDETEECCLRWAESSRRSEQQSRRPRPLILAGRQCPLLSYLPHACSHCWSTRGDFCQQNTPPRPRERASERVRRCRASIRAASAG